MATIPSDALPPSLMNIVVDARNSNGAHAYYSNGWGIKDTKFNSKAILPAWLYKDCSYTVVFKHEGTRTTSMYQLILGIWNHEDEHRVAIQSKDFYTSLVTENKKAQTKSADIKKIELGGFHVVEYKHKVDALEVFLDGTACLIPRAITHRPEEYTVFKGEPLKNNPFSIWEGHFIFQNYKTLKHFRFHHENMFLGTGSYIQIHADWTKTIQIWPSGARWKVEVPSKLGEQIITVRAYRNRVAVTTSSPIEGKEEAVEIPGHWPLSPHTDCNQEVNALYSVTVYFAEIISQ